jgi:hypothetical protein
MAPSALISRLEDILEAISVIAEYTAGKTFDDYAAERMLRDAIERNVEPISEASRHIPKSLKAGIPSFPGGRSPASATSCVTLTRSSMTASCGKSSLAIFRSSRPPPGECCTMPSRREPHEMAAPPGTTSGQV